MNGKYINMYDLLICFASAGDLISHELKNHHQQVAYLSVKIADELNLSFEDKKELIIAGLLHDVGTLSLEERFDLLESEPTTVLNHGFRGAWLIEGFAPLKNAANIIRYHHFPWKNGSGDKFEGKEIPYLSHIIHLADRVVVSINKNDNVLGQIRQIQEDIISKKNSNFMPEVVDAFLKISEKEYIWLDLVSEPLLYHNLPEIFKFDVVELNLDNVIELTNIFSKIIDFRSPFTAYHSAGVAKVAEKISELAGFSKVESKMMLVAGYLHDIGKLAVKNDILLKEDALNTDEFNEIKSHSFYTYRLLQNISGFETINKWASLHHEKLNGTGYPFHLHGDSIPLGARIMAVADVFTAITEDRPYRKGMSDREAILVLEAMADNQSICPCVVSTLISNYEMINSIRIEAQKKANEEYQNFVDEKII